ncbi:MAG TPA: Plug domain-containing protein, partial [Sphingopyxis sp.]|nr:Plug domain-containing protein [Sphingopyxis sp.]
MKQGLFVAASMVAVAAAAPVQAEEAAAVESAGEIVVTAQKRVQNVQDVPISIAVVSGEDLQEQGSASLVDYAGYVPGMNVSNGGTPGQTTITLRGVAPLNSAQTVGIYLDDAPVGSSALYNRAGAFTIDLMPYDLERIEVLKGPQGTLYGASSIGGLVKYVTVQPDTTQFRVRAGVEGFTIKDAGSLGWGGQVYANAPIVTDKLAISGSFAWRKT